MPGRYYQITDYYPVGMWQLMRELSLDCRACRIAAARRISEHLGKEFSGYKSDFRYEPASSGIYYVPLKQFIEKYVIPAWDSLLAESMREK